MSSTSPTISVLMPVYNAEAYLVDAVESILNQTYDDFEFIIIDDGSTDGSLSILKRFAAADRRIRLVSRENTGLVIALNQMLGMARGDLIARMDADDIALPHRLELQTAWLAENDEVVCLGGGVELIDEDGVALYRPTPVCGNDLVQREALQGRTPICHPAAMFRSEACASVGNYRQKTYPAEDLDLWLRLGEIGKLDNLTQCILRYRLHPQSVSVRKSQQQLAKMRMVCEDAWKRRSFEGTFHAWPDSATDSARNGRPQQYELTVHSPLQNPFANAMLLASRNAVNASSSAARQA